MSLDELFEDVFAVTCGVSRASVLASDRYSETLKKYWEGARYRKLMSVGDDYWGDIYEAPVTPEFLAQPLTLERDERNSNRVFTEIHELGEQLIQVADTFLTPQSLSLVERFRAARLSAKGGLTFENATPC